MVAFRVIYYGFYIIGIGAILVIAVFYTSKIALTPLLLALILLATIAAMFPLIWFGGLKGNTYHISLGDITFFVMMVNMLFRPIRMLADRLNTLQMGFVSAERVFKVLDTNEHIPDQGKRDFQGLRESLEFRNVWFAYRKEHYVLQDVSFRIRAGETIALVGPTGGGKSTIVNLVCRFYEPKSGRITRSPGAVSSTCAIRSRTWSTSSVPAVRPLPSKR